MMCKGGTGADAYWKNSKIKQNQKEIGKQMVTDGLPHSFASDKVVYKMK